MQQLFKDYRPEVFEDIVALGALYRPGPLNAGMVKDFVGLQARRKPVASLHPLVDEVVKPTRGVIVYQERLCSSQRARRLHAGGADLSKRWEEAGRQDGQAAAPSFERAKT